MSIVTWLLTVLAGPFGWIVLPALVAAVIVIVIMLPAFLVGTVIRWHEDRHTARHDDQALAIVFEHHGKRKTADELLAELEQAREHDDDTFQWDGLTSELNRMLGRDGR